MALVQEQIKALLERWKQEMQRLPLPAHIQVTEGEAEKVMELIATAVLKAVDDDSAAVRFEADGDCYGVAGDLGCLRKSQGFSIEELVQEHIILRNEFWNIFREQVDMKHVVDFALEKRINGCFDILLQASASAYQYEYSREIMENPLRDAVTDLHNKSYFHGRMIEELRRSVRYDHEISLVLFEVSNYYQVKEAEGGEQVNEFLRFIAGTLSRMTRDCDVVARMGEGSFAVLLPETGWRGGGVMAERLSKYFHAEMRHAISGESTPELTWGLASFPDEVRLPEKLYACAVEAMRSSRSLGPGEVVIYRSSENRGVD
ncbi:MAG: GGDEF domain-containing protein [Actinomycetota bacterium]|nr:GGDEF domain-containing protein [Actinomycetota bacterium]